MEPITVSRTYPVSGAGLGMRLELMDELCRLKPAQIGFLELAPKNWRRPSGARGKRLDELKSLRYPAFIVMA